MKSLYELIELLLEETYSKDIKALGSDLCNFGASTIQEIMKRQKLDFVSVRNLLIILMQNKLVSYEEVVKKKLKNEEITEFIYELDIENILMKLRYPKISYLINQKFGEIGSLIFEEFMELGILSSQQCSEQVKEKLESNNNRNTKNYLVQCSKKKSLELKDSYKDKKKNKNKTKKKEVKYTSYNEEGDDVEMKEDTTLLDINLIPDDHPLIYNKEKDKPILYFINFEKVLNELKIEIIEDFIRQKINFQAGTIISIMLRKMDYITLNVETSNFAVSAEEIVSNKENNLMNLKLSSIKDLLELMTKDEFEFLIKWGLNHKGNEIYCLNLDSIFNTIKCKTIEKLIEQQYSSNHVRIYRLLSKCGPIDTKNIMEFCMIPLKETSNYLNQMIQDNILQTQQINIKGVNTNFFTINTKNNIKMLITKIYRIILNLKIYLNSELEKIRLAVEEKDETKAEDFISKIYSTINELDDTIIVLKYFE